jgi:hypothetical protein
MIVIILKMGEILENQNMEKVINIEIIREIIILKEIDITMIMETKNIIMVVTNIKMEGKNIIR